MRRYRYRVERVLSSSRAIVFEIVILAASDEAASLQAGELGMSMGCLLVGPLASERSVWRR